MAVLLPLTLKSPAPLTLEGAVRLCVPALKSSVAPAATVNAPPLLSPPAGLPATLSVPLVTLTVPALLKARVPVTDTTPLVVTVASEAIAVVPVPLIVPPVQLSAPVSVAVALPPSVPPPSVPPVIEAATLKLALPALMLVVPVMV
jgi:hypothetical protein